MEAVSAAGRGWGDGGVCGQGHGIGWQRTGIWNGEAAAGVPGRKLRTVLASWTVTWSGPADHEESYFLLAFQRSVSFQGGTSQLPSPVEPVASRFRYNLANWNDYRLPCCFPGTTI